MTRVRNWTYRDICHDPLFHFHVEASSFPDTEYAFHTHDFAELAIVRHGTGTHVLEGHEYVVGSGDVFLLRPNEVHGYGGMHGLEILNLCFDPEIFLQPEPSLNHLPGYHAMFDVEPRLRHAHYFAARLHLKREQLAALYACVEPLVSEYKERGPGYEAAIAAHFKLLVLFLSRRYGEQDSPASRDVLRLSNVASFIEANYSEPMTLERLADVACMSKNSLLRAFQRCYGTSPIDYLNQFRLRQAIRLLADEGLSIAEVSHAVGFGDSNYFTRQFRKAFGLAPRAYRTDLARARAITSGGA